MPSTNANIVTSTPVNNRSRPFVVIWVLALLPCLMVLLTWDSDGILTATNYSLRHY